MYTEVTVTLRLAQSKQTGLGITLPPHPQLTAWDRSPASLLENTRSREQGDPHDWQVRKPLQSPPPSSITLEQYTSHCPRGPRKF